MSLSFGGLFIPFLIWSIFWKGMALWRSARLGQRNWFIAILVLNTIGVLEIIYLYYITEPEKKEILRENKE